MKSILIVHEDVVNGQLKMSTSVIPFSKNTVEYCGTMTYRENMESMIYEILESGFAFLSEKTAIPIFCIKAFQANNDDFDKKEDQKPQAQVQNQQNQNSEQSKQKVSQNQLNKKWKHNKKMHRRINNHMHQANTNGNVQTAVIAVRPEEIIKQIES